MMLEYIILVWEQIKVIGCKKYPKNQFAHPYTHFKWV